MPCVQTRADVEAVRKALDDAGASGPSIKVFAQVCVRVFLQYHVQLWCAQVYYVDVWLLDLGLVVAQKVPGGP